MKCSTNRHCKPGSTRCSPACQRWKPGHDGFSRAQSSNGNQRHGDGPMNYERILQYVVETPWAILPTKLTEILSVLAFRASGQAFTAAEIRARIGDRSELAPTATKRGGVAVIPIRGVIAHRMGSMDDSSGG